MQTRSSDENSVCSSVFVCLSVKCVHCDKTEERAVQFFYHTKDQLTKFFRRRMVAT